MGGNAHILIAHFSDHRGHLCLPVRECVVISRGVLTFKQDSLMLIEVVQGTREEVQKEKPNVTKLKSLLSTVGASIQVMSNLKPVYEFFKQALTLRGDRLIKFHDRVCL